VSAPAERFGGSVRERECVASPVCGLLHSARARYQAVRTVFARHRSRGRSRFEGYHAMPSSSKEAIPGDSRVVVGLRLVSSLAIDPFGRGTPSQDPAEVLKALSGLPDIAVLEHGTRSNVPRWSAVMLIGSAAASSTPSPIGPLRRPDRRDAPRMFSRRSPMRSRACGFWPPIGCAT
jgi:hypothetical protein